MNLTIPCIVCHVTRLPKLILDSYFTGAGPPTTEIAGLLDRAVAGCEPPFPPMMLLFGLTLRLIPLDR